MKLSLHLKVWILLGYVVLCTMLVLLDPQGDMPAPFDPAVLDGDASQTH